MKQFLNQHTLANDARMRRALFAGTFVFAEGTSDAKLYGMFIDKNECQIIIAHNRFNVVEACRVLESDNFAGAVGIVDADFDHLEGNVLGLASVFQTDMHDGECFMLATGAFEKLLLECAAQEKIQAWQKCNVIDVRSHLLQQAVVIAGLLWHSNRSGLNLCFSELEPKEYVDDNDLKLDIPKFIRHVKNKSQRHDLNDKELTAALHQKLESSDRIWQMVRGHDVIDLLCFALRKTLGSWKAQEATREHIERGLRLAYAEDDFCQTQLFLQIRKWEADHKPFRVFRNLRQQTFGLVS